MIREFRNANYPDLFLRTARNFRPALGHLSVWLSGRRSIHCTCEGCVRKSPKAMPLSLLESARRAFLSLLLRLGRSHAVPLQISRESPDQELLKAYRRISKKVRPDRGGSLAQSQSLNASKYAWEEARKKSKCPGRPARRTDDQTNGRADGQAGRVFFFGRPRILPVRMHHQCFAQRSSVHPL